MNARDLQHLYRKSSRSFYRASANSAAFFGLLAVSIFTWSQGLWYLSVACWIVQAHVGHVSALAFHEASHYTLHPRRSVNESFGIVIGCFLLTPLSAYRYAHNQHHTNLGTSRDPDLWPYCNPATPRWLRLLAVVGELVFAFFYTPFLFLRSAVLVERLPASTQRRIVVEYALIAAVWGTILAATAYYSAWEWLLVGLVFPSMIAGNLQSLRKFVEHLGLLGDDVASSTRTVVDPTLFGRILSHTMLHIDYHGPHHSYAKIPFHHLPEATAILYGDGNHPEETANFYPSYARACWAMAKTLYDPRVGKQWVERPVDVTPSNPGSNPDTSAVPSRHEMCV